MKKIIIILAVLIVAVNADAQIKLGVKTGLNISDMSFSDEFGQNLDNLYANRIGWHLGMVMKVKIPNFPLVLQPELLFSTKGFNGENGGKKLRLNYIEVPINLQWGIQLGKVRPYAELSPYFSYLVGSNKSLDELNSWDGGLGLGAGIDIWKLQISCKYVWGFGKVGDIKDDNNGEVIGSVKNRGIQISLGYFL
jgi:hypothetical protein